MLTIINDIISFITLALCLKSAFCASVYVPDTSSNNLLSNGVVKMVKNSFAYKQYFHTACSFYGFLILIKMIMFAKPDIIARIPNIVNKFFADGGRVERSLTNKKVKD